MIPLSTPSALVAAAPTLLRQGLVAILREWWPALRLTLTADVTQVAELLASGTFGLLVLDGALPGRRLPALLARLHRAHPAQRCLLLTDECPPEGPARPGPQLRLPRHVPPPALAAALAPWLDAPGGTPPRPAGPRPPAEGFSPRELEVLRLVMDDYCNDEIANRLFINVRTVESHRRNLLQKAGARTLVSLAVRAVREGWVA